MYDVELKILMNDHYAILGRLGNIIELLEKYAIITYVIEAVAIIIGIAILWNQRKIKKQLRQLLEERKKEEDKP